MHSSIITTQHAEVRSWIESHNGAPALNDTGYGRGYLAINFGEEREFQPISWEEFFDQFESHHLAFTYAKDTAHDTNDGEDMLGCGGAGGGGTGGGVVTSGDDGTELADEFSYSFVDRRYVEHSEEIEADFLRSPFETIMKESMLSAVVQNKHDQESLLNDDLVEDSEDDDWI